ncbi:MAG: GAF domain-containing protein [Thermomicrobiales bacterium]
MESHGAQNKPAGVVTSAADWRDLDVRFRTLFEQSPVSTQVFAPDGTPLLVNRAWERLWNTTLDQIAGYNIRRDTQLAVRGLLPAVERGFAGEPTTLPPIQYAPGAAVAGLDAIPYRWVRAVIFPVKDESGQVREVVVQHEDITAQQEAYQHLEERVAERTRELTTLLEVSRRLAATLELTPLLDLIFEQLAHVVPYTGAAVWLLDAEGLALVADRAPEGQPRKPGLRIPRALTPWVETVPPPVIVADVQDERDQSPAARSYRMAVGGQFTYNRAWMRIPLVYQDQVLGMLSLSHREPGYYTAHHADLAQAIASGAAVAIANARLYERTRATTALTHIAASLTIDQSLETTLDSLAGSVVAATRARACSVVLIYERTGLAHTPGEQGLPPGYVAAMEESWRNGARSPTVAAFRERTMIVVRDQPRWALAEPLFAPCHPFLRRAEWDKAVVVPIIYRGAARGAINVYYRPGFEPSPEEETVLHAIADQAAVVVENTRLYGEARRSAALEERQRLARELHDSVTQALFSATLQARATQLALERAGVPADSPAGHGVAELRALTQGALAEMRALIFELRPGALAEEGLVAALRKQAAALTAREGMQLAVLAPEVRLALAPVVEEQLYRLAQEALHNVVKHAGASEAVVRLARIGDGLTLEITDNGRGFDPAMPRPGHLGLTTMAERAQVAGGRLDVVSAPGHGTTVRATVPGAMVEVAG